jgi:hypothetical protein
MKLMGTFVALALLAGTAWAAGTITGLTLTPQPACVNQPVTATITGTGSCNKVVMIWEMPGDVNLGTKDVMSPPPAFPITLQHTYTHTGQVTAKARPGTNSTCSGEKEIKLTVQDCGNGGSGKPWLAELCKVIDCVQITQQDPKLQVKPSGPLEVIALPRIIGGLGALQSGNPVIVGGERFGDEPGKVHLLATGGSLLLQINEWYDGGIGGNVPPQAANLCLTGEVQVERKDGKKSNTWIFAVPQVYKSLPASEVRVVHCGNDGNENSCNNVSISGETCHPQGLGGGVPFSTSGFDGASIAGSHANCLGAIGDDEGTDTYEISLKNGWVLDSAVFSTSFDPGEASTSPSAGQVPGGFQDGGTYWKPSIQWSVTPSDWVHYGLYVGIRGPECTSHK